VPDDCSSKRVSRYSVEFPGCKVISCFWFYFSAVLQYELPVEPFILSNEGERLTGSERVYDLVKKCLGLVAGDELLK
jgi:hypothetical protein